MNIVILAAASAVTASSPLAAGMVQMPIVVPTQRSGCTPIMRQVQEQAPRSRPDEFRSLDREPAANLLLAVDRQVDGCREVTFLRRDVAPGARTPNPGRTGRR